MKKLALAAALFFVTAPAVAQDTPLVAQSGTRPLIRPDGTYVFQHIPNSDLVFEAQIAPRIIIIDSIGRATRNVLAGGKPAVWGYQISASPMVRLRMFSETSNPVRTPSYMPKATVQLARFRNLSPLDDTDEPKFNHGPVEMWLLDVIPFGHHSNGQNGCLFTNQSRDDEGECVDDVPPEERAVNKENGSFSTNYLEASIHYGRMYLDSPDESVAAAGNYVTRAEWRAGIGIQLNPEGYVGGSIKPELSPLYGPTRVLFEGMGARRDLWRCGRAAADLRLQYITDSPAGIPSFITRIEGSCFPRRWGGAGIFVTYYHGQDYYNLGFAEKVSRLQFGITMQREQFLSFKASSQ